MKDPSARWEVLIVRRRLWGIGGGGLIRIAFFKSLIIIDFSIDVVSKIEISQDAAQTHLPRTQTY